MLEKKQIIHNKVILSLKGIFAKTWFKIGLLIFGICFVLVTAYVLFNENAPDNSEIIVNGVVTIYTKKLPLSGPYMANPLAGYYKWIGNEVVPLPERSKDSYSRYTWRELEPEKDKYDFSKIDKDLKAADDQGRKFAFRVRAMEGYKDNLLYVPLYMQPYGWWADTNTDAVPDTFIPDWNNNYFLDRVQKLFTALAQRYGDDRRISWVDIGIFGQYGEWYLSPSVNYNKAPKGIVPITSKTKNRLVDIQADAFHNKQSVILLLSDHLDAAQYAFSKQNVTYPIGWRTDCLGRPGFFDLILKDPKKYDVMKDRWQVAPIIGEFCNIIPGSRNIDEALKQVQQFHVSTIGNGNINVFTKFSDKEKQTLITIGKSAGYRIALNEIHFPAKANRGSIIPITTIWSNNGNAPIYSQWTASIRLKDGSGTVVATFPLTIDLKKLLPGSSAHNTAEDNAGIPNIPTGQYELDIIVTSDDYDSPLKLTIEGRQDDGAYRLGTIVIQ